MLGEPLATKTSVDYLGGVTCARRKCGVGWLIVLVVLVGAMHVEAEESSTVAVRVIRAHEAKDAAQLRSLARSGVNDPWLVADEVLQRGERDAAAAFAAAIADEERSPHLRAYVGSDRGAPILAVDRERLRVARAKRLQGNPAASIEILRHLMPRPGSVFCVLVWHETAMALRDLDKNEESARACVAGAKAAHAIGWRIRRNRLLRYVCYERAIDGRAYTLNSAYLAKARQAVRPSEAFVVYAEIGEEAVAVAVTQERTDFVPLGRRADVQRACDGVRAMRPEKAPRVAEARERLMAPLQLREGISRLLIVPQARLEDVSFSLVAPGRETTCLPWLMLWLIGDETTRGRGILAIHDPLVPAEAESGPRWSEARAVGSVLLGGRDATKEGLVRAVRQRDRWRAIHFACPFDVNSKSIVLAPKGRDHGLLNVNELIDMQLKADLLVFSGGLTARMSPSTGDGGPFEKFPRGDISKMGLDELKEFLGRLKEFRKRFNAFDLGPRYVVDENAPRAIVSLWKIDSSATRAFMKKFYELWNPAGHEGLPTATALRRAQEFVRGHEQWAHPLYWAGWQLWGRPD
jgi:hypothetical protein